MTEIDAAPLTAESREDGLRVAAEEVVRLAETDDDFDGAYIDYLVPAEALDALRAALRSGSPTDAMCGTCDGEGTLRSHGIDPIEVSCPHCDGSGRVPIPSGSSTDAALDRLDDAATEYFDAVTAYLDPENQFTESRRNAVTRTGLDLVAAIAASRSPARAASGSPEPVLDRLRAAAQKVIDSCDYVDGTAQQIADDRALDALRAALSALPSDRPGSETDRE